MRLRYSKRQIYKRGVKMVCRGLSSLDALDKAQRLESNIVISVQAIRGFGVIDWNAMLTDLAFIVKETPLAFTSNA